MQLFQLSSIPSGCRQRTAAISRGVAAFASRQKIFLDDRYGALHYLEPVLRGEVSAFFTNGNDDVLQRAWAHENGLPAKTPLDDILLAQIEHHRTEVFYNLDPVRWPSRFVARLPGSVRVKLAWRAAPSGAADFGAYDRVMCNFPGILDDYRRKGWGAAWFAPAHDPEMDAYAALDERPVDVVFVGGYTRHHGRRAKLIEALASLADRHAVVLHLDASRLTRLAESPLGLLPPLARHRRPSAVRRVARPGVFGRALYEAVAAAKIVVNGAIDMAGEDRGNMRCWEAMGLGSLLVSDVGTYPPGMVDGETMLLYRDVDDAIVQIERALADPSRRLDLARRGRDMVRSRYSKAQQWADFVALL